MGKVGGTHEEEAKCLQDFGGKIRKREATWKA